MTALEIGEFKGFAECALIFSRKLLAPVIHVSYHERGSQYMPQLVPGALDVEVNNYTNFIMTK